jgi:SAM-dependent methyltransferase
MTGPLLSPFTDPETHSISKDIIFRHSSNKNDVRSVALEGIDFSKVKSILDLGCGFGFMAEKIIEKTTPGTRVSGVDACEQNEKAFLSVFQKAGREAEFLFQEITTTLPFASENFDLAVSSYSLYFFPGIIPDVARMLKKEGTFIVITHSQTSFAGLYEAMGIKREDSEIPGLLRQFSSENGEEKLSACFGDIERIDFPNTLSFHEKHFNDLVIYAGFKLPLLLKECDICSLLPDVYKRKLLYSLSDKKMIVINKNDAIFRCRRPLCH